MHVGDAIGWYHERAGIIDFDTGGNDVHWQYPMEALKIGETITFATGGQRTYSVGAEVVLHAAPPPQVTIVVDSSGLDSQIRKIEIVGNELADRASPDGASQISFVDKGMVFSKPGKLVGWDFWVGRAGSQKVQVWRPQDAASSFALVCENEVLGRTLESVEHVEVSESDQCLVQNQDVVGWAHAGQAS